MTRDRVSDRFDQLRGIPLPSVLRASGARPDCYDKKKWHTAQGIISVTGMKFMNWNRSCGGGGAIDLIMHLKPMDFKSAIEWLAWHFPILPSCKPILSPRRWTLPLPDTRQLPTVLRYLAHQRALSLSLLQSLIASQRLYADHRGNAVFLLWGEQNQAVGAELRGTGAACWRGMASGSRKDLGYFALRPPDATRIILCESAIDAISCAQLHPTCWSISTAGARPNPRWLPLLLQQGYPVYCGFDADAIGDAMAQQMMSLYPNIGRLRPTQHDWNDVLKSRPTIPPPPRST
jgi:hypothetical protein